MTSCDENDCCTVIDTDIGVEYINKKGEDLLNPNTIGHFIENKSILSR